jgi:ADP-ribose pyrophosphatase YjhB (NUDIX family)
MARPVFVYCPMCATPLQERVVYGQRRRACPACTFVQFPDPKVAVIALVTQGDHLLLVQRGIEPARGKWTLPGGYMDAGEMPTSALQRELHEEVNLSVQVRHLLEIFPMVTTSGASQGIVLAFHAVPLTPLLPELRCEDDVCAARWFLPHEAPTDLAFDSTQQLLARWQAGWRP